MESENNESIGEETYYYHQDRQGKIDPKAAIKRTMSQLLDERLVDASKEDIALTQKLVDIFGPLEINVLDKKQMR